MTDTTYGGLLTYTQEPPKHAHKAARAQGYGICPVCKRRRLVRMDGRFKIHRGRRSGLLRCGGSGMECKGGI